MLLQAAVARGLVTSADARACLEAARRTGRGAEAILRERGADPAAVLAVQATLPPLEATLQPPTQAGATPPPAGPATYWNQADATVGPPSVDAIPTLAPTSSMWAQPSGTSAAPARRVFGAAPAKILPGTVLGGDWEVLEELGAGGMGAVYRARQLSLGREVAIKVLPAHQSGGQASERFLREARSAAAVSHPNVITVFAAGRDEATGRLFIAMELVPGGDAAALMARCGGRLPERRALELARDIARGLTALEAARLVHRDIKPANLFLAADGTAKLADLGLARGLADRMTETGAVVGTPAYMSPEQAQGTQAELDIGTDIYAVGASLYTLLTGKPPFEAPGVVHLLRKVLDAPPPDPRADAPEVSAATAAIVRRAMAKDRGSRHATAADLLTDLERALASLASAPRERPGAPALLAGALVAVGVLAAIGGVVLMTSTPGDAPLVAGATVTDPPSTTSGATGGPRASEPPPAVPTPTSAVDPTTEEPTATVEVREPISLKVKFDHGVPISDPPDGIAVEVTRGGTNKNGSHLILRNGGGSAVEARFEVQGAPTWAHLNFGHTSGKGPDGKRTYIDVEVNGVPLVDATPPESLGTLDITRDLRPGLNDVRITLDPSSRTVYWLGRFEVQYGWGDAPPQEAR